MQLLTVANALVALTVLGSSASALPRPSPQLQARKLNSIKYPPKYTGPLQTEDIFAVSFAAASTASTEGFTAPKTSPWASLTNDEAAGVIAFLHEQEKLNLTAYADAGSWDNMITTVDLLAPNKTDAVMYMDGKGPKPDRWAVVSIAFGATDEPYLEDFRVGPLPVSNSTTYIANSYYSTKGTTKIRNYDADYGLVVDFKIAIVAEVADIVSDLINATFTGGEDDNVDLWGIDPLWHEDRRIISWQQFWRNPTSGFNSGTLLPQGLYMKLDITGRDPSKWRFGGWFYNGEFYPTSAAFRSAWEKPSFEKLVPNYSGSWDGTDRVGPELPKDELAPPVQVAPGGSRFSVDVENGYVAWMDFTFYITFTRDTGVRIYDIYYKGNRIAYEWGLQEAIAQYAGQDPVQSGIGYLDSYYGFGPYAFNLVSGYDCPAYAHFLPATFHSNEISTTHPMGICIFESDQGYPLQRHSSSDYVSITKNIALVVRTVNTVGNYDYTFTYTFYMDGSFESDVKASGYIQSAYYANNDAYGYKIHESLSGSMHDHALTFKLDLDIAGTKNTLAKHTIKAENIKYPWSNHTRSTMRLYKDKVKTESKINWAPNAASMYIVENHDELNVHGVPKGYRIMPSKGAGMYLTIQNSSNLINAQSFATHALYALKHKDSEHRCAHAWNAYDPYRPIIEFDKYFNDESIEQEDIVLYYNLGMHHVPHTGDLSNTVMTTAQAGMIMSPHNYLLIDPSRQTKQQLRINYTPEGVTGVETFGQNALSGSYDLASATYDYNGYSGDVNVRKLPYSPSMPYNDTISI